MDLSFENVDSWKDNLWMAELPVRLLQTFPGRPTPVAAPLNLVVLGRQPVYSIAERRLTVDIDSCRILARGSNTFTILTFSPETAHGETKTDDSPVLSELATMPKSVMELGMKLVQGVRLFDSGALVKRSRRWVGTPNYWTFTPQPQARDIQVTVAGNVDDFPSELVKSLPDFKPDRPSYSRFKIREATDVAPALKVLKHAKGLRN